MSDEKKEQEAKKPTLIVKLGLIQTELKAPKNQRNNFGGYNYRSAEDILEAVKPLAIKHGAVVRIFDEVHQVGDRIYVKATVVLHDLDSNDSIQTTAFAREEETKKGMDGSQITGAASSYARKYALNGMFAIDDTKDSDATNDHGKSEQPKKPVGQQAKVHPKYVKAWHEYSNLPDVKGLKAEVLKANFKKLCVDITGNDNALSYGDAEWDKVLSAIEGLGA